MNSETSGEGLEERIISLTNTLKPIKDWLKENKDFLLGSALLISTAIADYYFTNLNMRLYSNPCIAELNPLIKNFITHYGKEAGMLIPKTGLTGIVIGVAYEMDKTPHAFKKVSGKHLLYFGSALNAAMALGNLLSYINSL